MRKIKFFTKWIAAFLGLFLAIALVTNAILHWRIGTGLQEQLDRIHAAGEPMKLADLTRDPIPPASNAAVFLLRAEEDLEAVDRELASLNGERNEYLIEDQLTAKGAELVAATLAAHPEALSLLAQAADAPDYDPQLDFGYSRSPDEVFERLLPRLQANRRAARMQSWHTRLMLHNGDHDAALRSALVTLRLGQHFSTEPMIVSHLVALAVRGIGLRDAALVLSAGEVTADARKLLDGELERQITHDPAAYRHMLTTERAFGMEKFHELGNGFGAALVRWRFRNDECDYLTALATEMENSRVPYHRTAGKPPAVNLPAPAIGPLTASFLPALQAARSAQLRVDVTARCLRVLSALQVHAPEPGVQSPDLATLGLPADLTTDPCDGQPLRVVQLPEGWMVYSVGENRVDDKGSIKMPYKDIGVATADSD